MKRILPILASTVLLFLACVPTPEVDAVKQKDTVQMIETVIAADKNADADTPAESVREQMPERLNWDFTTDARHIHITAVAPIRVLSDAGFPLLRCERRQLSSAQNIGIAKAFLKTDPLYRSVGRRTKEDVAKQIQNLMETLADTERKGDIWKNYTEEEIAELLPRWQQALEDAQALYRTMDDDDIAGNPVWDGTIDDYVDVMPNETENNSEYCDSVWIDTGRELPLFWQMRYTKKGEAHSAWGYKELECIDPSQYGAAHEGTGITPYQAIAQVQALLDPFVKTTVDSVHWDDNRSDTADSDPDFRLAYMDHGLLVPAWFFFGSFEYTEQERDARLKQGFFPEEAVRNTYNSEHPLLIINAIDGTIIDPEIGY